MADARTPVADDKLGCEGDVFGDGVDAAIENTVLGLEDGLLVGFLGERCEVCKAPTGFLTFEELELVYSIWYMLK